MEKKILPEGISADDFDRAMAEISGWLVGKM